MARRSPKNLRSKGSLQERKAEGITQMNYFLKPFRRTTSENTSPGTWVNKSKLRGAKVVRLLPSGQRTSLASLDPVGACPLARDDAQLLLQA